MSGILDKLADIWYSRPMILGGSGNPLVGPPPKSPFAAPGIRDIPFESVVPRMRALTPQEDAAIKFTFPGQPVNNIRVQDIPYNPWFYGLVDPQLSRDVVNLAPNAPFSTVAHEATHTVQYHRNPNLRKGAKNDFTYDYGGSLGLEDARRRGVPWKAFGIEQQAQIIQDGLRYGFPPGSAWEHYRNEFLREVVPQDLPDASAAFLESVFENYQHKRVQ